MKRGDELMARASWFKDPKTIDSDLENWVGANLLLWQLEVEQIHRIWVVERLEATAGNDFKTKTSAETICPLLSGALMLLLILGGGRLHHGRSCSFHGIDDLLELAILLP